MTGSEHVYVGKQVDRIRAAIEVIEKIAKEMAKPNSDVSNEGLYTVGAKLQQVTVNLLDMDLTR